jgi:hypothetical protein
MIKLSCTNCKASLDIDEAFAGGVCRCMYCGTIQTVPSHLRRKASNGAKSSSPKVAHKALFHTVSRPGSGDMPGSGTGLNDLADVVASSGLVGSGLRGQVAGSTPRRAAPPAPPPKWWQHKPVVLSIGAAAALVVVLLVVIFAVAGNGDSAPASDMRLAGGAGSSGPAGADEQPVMPSPNFCGVPIGERVVVYVLDRGSATGDMFGDLKEACFNSIESLGAESKFQIIFWNNGSEESFPRSGPTPATAANLDSARRALDAVNAHGQSDPTSALKKAFASNPGAIVLATGKGYELDEQFVRSFEQLRGDNRAKVYTFALGSGDPGTALKLVASNTGGEFRAVTTSHLKEYGD